MGLGGGPPPPPRESFMDGLMQTWPEKGHYRLPDLLLENKTVKKHNKYFRSN